MAELTGPLIDAVEAAISKLEKSDVSVQDVELDGVGMKVTRSDSDKAEEIRENKDDFKIHQSLAFNKSEYILFSEAQ